MWPFSSSYPALNASQVRNLTSHKYDYIVVGGGTAGCCLAARLSEDPAVKVLLVERGSVSDDWVSQVPLLSSNFFRHGAPVARWKVAPLPFAPDRVLHAVTGQGLGGASLINGAVYTRGIGDYNKWTAYPGWTYDQLEPYFIKSEQTHSHANADHRGHQGPWINQRFTDFRYKIQHHFRDAAKSLGIPVVTDVNSPEASATCFITLDLCIDKNKHRVSTAQAFLPHHVAASRKGNLTICTNSTVMRLCFSDSPGQGRHVVGLYLEVTDPEPDHEAAPVLVHASKEVILCAGAVGSPQILMLSGIGPAAHLREHGLQVVKDLPGVGSYLRDHSFVPLAFEVPMNESLHVLFNKPVRALVELLRYVVTGNGLFTIPFLQSTIFVHSDLLNENMELKDRTDEAQDTRNPNNLPDIEIMPCHVRSSEPPTDELDRVGVFGMLPCLLQPKSFGSVRLQNTDPQTRAVVNLGFLEHADDLAKLRKAIRLALRIAQVIRKQGHTLTGLRIPATDSDADIDEYIRRGIQTAYHYSSTCRMAPENDIHPGVVDGQLKVHGIEGLRVCDTSIFPDILTTHTMAGAVVVAEKCADLIKTGK
ncbi:alcohol oxidase [Mycena floridula]|nr:alcohol oxidase [Mycena floridula]